MMSTTVSRRIWVPLAAVLVVALLAGAWAVGEAYAQDGTGEGGFLQRWKKARRVSDR